MNFDLNLGELVKKWKIELTPTSTFVLINYLYLKYDGGRLLDTLTK